jgi:Tfp pilus assembly protein PilX
MLSLILLAGMRSSEFEMQLAGGELENVNAFYAAESGLESGYDAIRVGFQTNGAAPNPLPSGNYTLNNYQTGYNSVSLGAATQSTLTSGAYKGLYGLAQSFRITSQAQGVNNSSDVTLESVVQDALIPLFQFAVFYEDDLEWHPGPAMTLGGRVHTNKNMYLGANTSLSIDSYTTAAGSIIHGRKAGSGQALGSGGVFIKDAAGNYQNMENGGTWLDSTDPDWVADATSRWGGKVEDQAFGITQLYMPVVTGGAPEDLIDRGTASSYENKAGLKIVDGSAYYNSGGTWFDVTANLTSSGTLSQKTFYDDHENKWVTSWDIDVAKLNTSGYFPSNGIVYASRDDVSGTIQGIRLVNGSTLGAGLTLASDNPVYVKGNFNTSSKKGAAIIADAVTILSSSWNDANSDDPLNSRVASNTTVNASLMTGNTVTGQGGNGYNGGLENLPRFLEKWDGKSFTWRGSMVDLWNSRKATSPWSYGSYYTAPNRDWGFDPDLMDINKLPPGTPMVNIVQKVSWAQK